MAKNLKTRGRIMEKPVLISIILMLETSKWITIRSEIIILQGNDAMDVTPFTRDCPVKTPDHNKHGVKDPLNASQSRQ